MGGEGGGEGTGRDGRGGEGRDKTWIAFSQG